jgi:hypothetical protein
LETLIPPNTLIDIPYEFYRSWIYSVILTQKMTWARSITLGRERLLTQLSRDEQQCFRSALLTGAPPPDDVVEWWDALSARMRQETDKKKMDRARDAERLTLRYERERLTKLGIMSQPRWVAIENNTAGHDILSYDHGEFGPINRLIEVKSTIASPLRFYVTRNEWEQAVKFAASYHFHIWDQ